MNLQEEVGEGVIQHLCSNLATKEQSHVQLVTWHAPGEAFLAEVQACGHQTDIAFLQGIIHNPLILLHLPEAKH